MTLPDHLGVFDAVIFDFDGTLADSEESILLAFTTWAEEYGLTDARSDAFTGLPTEAVARALLPAHLAEEGATRLDWLEISDTRGVTPLPGAAEALDALTDSRRAIATSCTTALVDGRLTSAGLAHPAVIVTRDMVERGKPAPDSFLLAAQRLGFAPERCLVVEDAPAGVAGARAAGCAALGVLTTHTAEELGADWHVGTLAEVAFEQTADGVRVSAR